MDETGSVERTFRVGIVPLPGFALMSYACTVEPLRAANLLSRRPLYEIVHFGRDETVASSGQARVGRTFPVGRMEALDLLLVVAGGDPFAVDDPALLRWLKRMAGRTGLVGGVSGAPVVLCKAGLMEGRRMTVHWEHAAELAERYPETLIERRLYVIDRDRVTCGGGTSPLDMMHAIIASHHGGVFARLVSDWFLHTDIRASAAPQRAGLPERIGVRSPHVLEAVASMEDHIADPLTLDQLALVAGVSPRHLNRLFNDVLGQSAMDYYRHLRLDVARRLVRGSALPVADVAGATGFATPSHFSTAYAKRFGTGPAADRRAA